MKENDKTLLKLIVLVTHVIGMPVDYLFWRWSHVCSFLEMEILVIGRRNEALFLLSIFNDDNQPKLKKKQPA